MQNLLNQKVELFDKSGGVLDESGEYVTDWWDVGEIVLQNVGRYLFFRNLFTGKLGKVKAHRVLLIEENQITLST